MLMKLKNYHTNSKILFLILAYVLVGAGDISSQTIRTMGR
jgi:hypothetical protein